MNTPLPPPPPPGGPWDGIIGPARHLWPDGSWRDTPFPFWPEPKGSFVVTKVDLTSRSITLEWEGA